MIAKNYELYNIVRKKLANVLNNTLSRKILFKRYSEFCPWPRWNPNLLIHILFTRCVFALLGVAGYETHSARKKLFQSGPKSALAVRVAVGGERSSPQRINWSRAKCAKLKERCKSAGGIYGGKIKIVWEIRAKKCRNAPGMLMRRRPPHISQRDESENFLPHTQR